MATINATIESCGPASELGARSIKLRKVSHAGKAYFVGVDELGRARVYAQGKRERDRLFPVSPALALAVAANGVTA